MGAVRIASVILSVHPPDEKRQDNSELIAGALQLWWRLGEVVLDPTWGEGKFYRISEPPGLIQHDKYTLDGVDFRHLPEEDESVDMVIFDPPYVSTGGRDTSKLDDFNEDYGVLTSAKTPEENSFMIRQGIFEAYRVLRHGVPEEHGGILMVKCCNYISGTHFFPGRRFVELDALAAGFTQVDEFVIFGGTGAQPKRNPNGTTRRQMHARRAHSYLSVFQKVRR